MASKEQPGMWCVAVLALAIFGANGFMLPALLATSGILIFAGRKEVQA